MRLLLIIAVVIGLAACTAPSRDFRGIPAQRITVEGSVFDVRVRGERAEAVRVKPPCWASAVDPNPRQALRRATMAAAEQLQLQPQTAAAAVIVIARAAWQTHQQQQPNLSCKFTTCNTQAHSGVVCCLHNNK